MQRHRVTASLIFCGRGILMRLKRCTETIRLPEERSNCSMANSLCSAPTCSLKAPAKPGIIVGKSVAGRVLRINDVSGNTKNARFQSLEVKATEKNQSTKPNSIVCADCDGNGAKQCSQCQGTGVNSVDHFNGQFKAGGLCWLCRGKREILCGSCNGAGFIGGFMSTFDD